MISMISQGPSPAFEEVGVAYGHAAELGSRLSGEPARICSAVFASLRFAAMPPA
jgi:hypothetical protein